MGSMIGILLLAGGIPAIGPDQVSGEMAQSVDLSGKWEGTLFNEGLRVRLEKGEITVEHWPVKHPGHFTIFAEQIIDEGSGRLHTISSGQMYLGICQQIGDKLIICEQHASFGYPLSFRDDGYHHLLIFKRVKRFK